MNNRLMKEEYEEIEKICDISGFSLESEAKKIIEYLKERCNTYGELLKKLDEFEGSPKWKGPKEGNELAFIIVMRAKRVIQSEMSDLEIKSGIKKESYKDFLESQIFSEKVKSIVGKELVD